MPYRPSGISLGAGGGGEGERAVAGTGPLVASPMNHPAVGTHLDLDLLGIFRVAMEEQRFSALGTDTSLGRQYGELVHDRQMGVIPSLRTRVVRLLAPFPLRSPGVVLGIVQVMGAITSSRGLRAFPEEIRLELAFFPFESFGVLLQRGDPSQGIAMATLPISGLLAELEVLSFEALDLGAEVSDFLAQSRHQGDQPQGGVAGATGLDQLAIHDQPGSPKMEKRGRGESPQFREEANWQTQLRRSFTTPFP
jgi:hypothetical protein